MEFMQPGTWADALAAKAEVPAALPIIGGTDVMVDLNFDRQRPAALLDLTRAADLADWAVEDGLLRIGAGVTYTRIIHELADRLPGLAMASRTIGSPQIRNRGTVGGNLGAAPPAGDAHPAPLATGAGGGGAPVRGTRVIPAPDFYTGVKRNALEPDELIAAALIPAPTGPQQFAKIGTRNAMVISVAAFGLALHPDRKQVGTGIGSAPPTPRRATDAERFLAGELDAAGLWESRAAIPETLGREFGDRVRAAAAPIADVAGPAADLLPPVAVMARRCLKWAWNDYQNEQKAA